MNPLAEINEESNTMMITSRELEPIIETIKDAQPISHLPGWVLKMRLRIADSKLQHDVVQSAISNLHQKSFALEKQLSKLSKDTISSKSNKELLVDTNFPFTSSNIFSNKQLDRNTDHIIRDKIVKKCYIYSLPSDVFSCILEYLQLFHLIRLNGLSKSFQSQMDSSLFWIKALPLYCPHLELSKNIKNKALETNLNVTMYELKAHFDAYIKNISLCLTFIRTMKDQRCIPRHREIQPHRHRKQEKEVTHPLPLFGGSNRHLSSSQQQQDGLIMSHAETLSSDYRSIAHRSLSAMLIETSFIDNPLNIKLIHEGIVTVLTSLLSNEEGALQNYACGIFGNLLCWESRHTHLFDIYTKHKSTVVLGLRSNESVMFDKSNIVCLEKLRSILLTISALFGIVVDDCTTFLSSLIPLSSQLTACRADRHLATLLTSPTASINLIAGSNVLSNDIRRTANVQGMCNKQACRALISLFSPAMAIPNTVATNTNTKSSYNNNNNLISLFDGCSSNCGLESEICLTSGNKSQQQQQQSDSHYSSSSSVSGLFTTDEVSKPWIFTYFHKSGSFKDQFIAYLRFLPGNTMQGRGIDSIGVFSLKGNAILDIIGWTWYLQKTYVRSNSIELVLGLSVLEWIQLSDESSLSDLEHTKQQQPQLSLHSKANTHVSHVAYWSSGTAIEEEEYQEHNLLHKDIVNIPNINLEYYHESNGTGVWGLGLYGVWETSSDNTPHFDLQKGGVFRAIPIIIY